MTISVSFYKFMLSPAEKIVPRLVDKIYKADLRTVIIMQDEDCLKSMNTSLWTFTTLAFLPHGCHLDCDSNAKDQPIWLTTTLENPNDATVCVLCTDHFSSVPEDFGFERILYVFDGTSEQALEHHSVFMAHCLSKAYAISFWTQTKEGWQKDEMAV